MEGNASMKSYIWLALHPTPNCGSHLINLSHKFWDTGTLHLGFGRHKPWDEYEWTHS